MKSARYSLLKTLALCALVSGFANQAAAAPIINADANHPADASLESALKEAAAHAAYAKTLKRQLREERQAVASKESIIQGLKEAGKNYAAGARRVQEMETKLEQEREFIGRLQVKLDDLEATIKDRDQTIKALQSQTTDLRKQLTQRSGAAKQSQQQQQITEKKLHEQLNQVATQLDEFVKKEITQVRVLPNQMTRIRLASDALFSANQIQLSDQGRELLKQVAERINGSNSRTVRINSYTDQFSQYPVNFRNRYELTRTQANNLAFYLQRQLGVNRRLIPVGAGSSNPLASDQTHQGRTLNRRVEILLDPDKP